MTSDLLVADTHVLSSPEAFQRFVLLVAVLCLAGVVAVTSVAEGVEAVALTVEEAEAATVGAGGVAPGVEVLAAAVAINNISVKMGQVCLAC